MSGKDRITYTAKVEPFDLARLASGEAYAFVTTPDGRVLAGALNTEEMLVPSGETKTIRSTVRPCCGGPCATTERC